MKRGLRILLLADQWTTFALGMLGPIYALFVAEIGGGLLDASWAYFALLFSSGIMIYFMGHWEDHIERKEYLVFGGYLLTGIGCMCYYFVTDQASLLVAQVVLGISEAIQLPAYLAMYSKYLDNGSQASEWGDWESLRYIVTAIAAVIGGYTVHFFGFKTLFLTMSVFCFIGALAVSPFLYKSKQYLGRKPKKKK
jgi:MFS family permease